MKNSRKVILAAAILLTSAACDRLPFSSGAGGDTTSSNSTSGTISRDRSIDNTESSSVSVSMPAYPLLIEAAESLASESEKNAVVDAILFASTPCAGWPPGGFRAHSSKIGGWVESVDAANSAATQILQSVSSRSLKNTTAAVDALKIGIREYARDEAAQDFRERKFKINVSGRQSYPIEFFSAAKIYGCDQSGWHILSAGVEIFGSGKVSGRDIQLSLQSDVSTSSSRSSGSGSSTETGVSTKSSADVRTN